MAQGQSLVRANTDRQRHLLHARSGGHRVPPAPSRRALKTREETMSGIWRSPALKRKSATRSGQKTITSTPSIILDRYHRIQKERKSLCCDGHSRSGQSAHAVMTAGIAALGPEAVARIVKTGAVYDDFCHANDPYEEHDFGSFEADGHVVFFKIDYFDKNLTYHSPDPSVTERVITIMLAEEYNTDRRASIGNNVTCFRQFISVLVLRTFFCIHWYWPRPVPIHSATAGVISARSVDYPSHL